MNKKILLFDIDGTLLHTGGVGRFAIEKACEEILGIPDAWKDTSPDGKTDPQIFDEISLRETSRTVADKDWEKLFGVYVKYFAGHIGQSPRFRIMPGVPELLQKLSADPSFALGIQTGNIEETALLKLQRAGINRYFAFGGYGSDARERKGLVRKAIERAQEHLGEKVPPEHIFVIGDARQDMDCGKALGVKTIAVLTGKTARGTIESAGPDLILEDLTQTENFLSFVTTGTFPLRVIRA